MAPDVADDDDVGKPHETGAAVLWSDTHLTKLEPRLLPTMRLVSYPARLDGVRALVVTPLPASWDPAPTAAQHATDDERGDALATTASSILRQLRSCGEWEVHPVEFGERGTTLMGMRLPHIDIAAIPDQRTSDAGLEVVRLVARRLLLQMANEPRTIVPRTSRLLRGGSTGR